MAEKEVGRNDWNAKLVEFFVQNGRLVVMVAAFIMIGGFISLVSLQREGFPQVSPKMLFIQTMYPGASSEEVERQISKPLEDAVKDANGVEEVKSTSMNSFSMIQVDLDEKTDIDQEIQEVRNKILIVEPELPGDAEKPQVLKFSTGGPPFVVAVSGKTTDLITVTDKIINELSQVDGVKSVKQFYEQKEELVISVDTEKMSKLKLKIDDLIQILKGSNVNFPVARTDIDDRNQTLVVVGALKTEEELGNVMVGFDARIGKQIRLKNIADINTGLSNPEIIDSFGIGEKNRHLSIKSGVLLKIELTKGADIIRANKKIDERINELKKDDIIPSGIDVDYIYNGARETRAQVDELISGAIGKKSNLWLLGGIQLLLIFMLLFVNFRSAVLAALSIPLSLGFTFITLELMGVTLNTIVLFSLILVLGLIVDPAIVIIESIQRFRDLGYKPMDAVRTTARLYGSGVFMATLTNWIVFIPFGVVSGIFGEIIRYIPITVVPALIASYFIPIAVLPWIASKVLKSNKIENIDEVESLWRAARGMIKINRWVLAKWWRQLLVISITVILTGLSLSLVVTGKVRVVQFSQPDDNIILSANVKFEKGLTFKDRRNIASRVEEKIKNEKGIENYYFSDQNKDALTAMMTLYEKRKPNDKSKKIVKRLSDSFKDSSDFKLSITEMGYSPPVSEYQIQVQLYDNNLKELKAAASKIGKYLSGLKGVEEVDDGVNSGSEPEVQLVLDREKAQAHGLGGFQVGQVLKTVMDKTKVMKFDDREHDRTMDVMLKVNGDGRPDTKDELNKLIINDINNQPVELSEIANIQRKQSLAKIERFEGQRYLTVKARVDEDKKLDVQRKLDKYLSDDRIKELKISGKGNKGEFEDIAKSFTELFIALVIAIGLTYMVLVLQFRSFSQPMIMLFTIPPALIGVFPVLWLIKSQFGFLELLGITILVGIVENVAIFLIDYANQRIKQDGMDPKEAIIIASGIRFRPIILTKFVALGSLLPLALESPFWRGLAVTIVAGVGLSGLFSMMIIPILFTLMINLKRKLGLN